jgi:hypothetical protein
MGGSSSGKIKLDCIDEKIGDWPVLLHCPDLKTPMQLHGNPER